MQNDVVVKSKLNSKIQIRQQNSLSKRKNGRNIPMFRYIPSREIMQRIIMRATLLPDNFTEFEPDY